jgi:hypothetical protein
MQLTVVLHDIITTASIHGTQSGMDAKRSYEIILPLRNIDTKQLANFETSFPFSYA